MIATLLISPSLEVIKAETVKTLASHLSSGNSSGNSNYFNHPDVLYFSSDSKLGILEARKIKEHFSLKPYSAKGRAVVLEDASVLTIEAQNALLKTLEELPSEAILILGATSDSKFLPTILSRCQIIYLNPHSTSDVDNPEYLSLQKDIETLLNSSLEERFAYIEKLKDREGFFLALVQYFHQNLHSHIESGNSDYQKFIKELLQAEKWTNQNVNIRAILEYLMLVMPN